MARAIFRIRCIPKTRIVNARPRIGTYQVQRRVAWLFWREVAIAANREEADLLLDRVVRERRVAGLRPKVIAEFDAHGAELLR
ncbi:hypothetical protein [Burkholderia ubonensis]|uniref:hypothetical protein n=1 Tax=Burkholderia ubonensis TaxID=101571 RepID=UPI000752514C|nr:hypothetical protein [Burkholderia ubonensis]KVP62194.1 hypothetical protein WJ90_26240 [Burkholderia ubonensis]